MLIWALELKRERERVGVSMCERNVRVRGCVCVRLSKRENESVREISLDQQLDVELHILKSKDSYPDF